MDTLEVYSPVLGTCGMVVSFEAEPDGHGSFEQGKEIYCKRHALMCSENISMCLRCAKAQYLDHCLDVQGMRTYRKLYAHYAALPS